MNFNDPVLIFGDPYISKNNIIDSKKKYNNIDYVTFSATDDSLNLIQQEACSQYFDQSNKIIVIQDLPNQKAIREFIIDLVKNCPSYSKIIVWDSNGHISVDPKTNSLNKTWSEFVNEFKSIANSKVINNGFELTHKQSDTCVDFIKKEFSKHGKSIASIDANILIGIVGYDRGMLSSEIQKLSTICPSSITSGFITEHAFPTSKEAILYHFSNALDSGSYEESINSMETLLNNDVHDFVLADMILRKARWQLAIVYYLSQGIDWSEITQYIMNMGQTPSSLVRSGKSIPAEYQKRDGVIKFLLEHGGLRQKHFHTKVKEKENRSERMPFSFQCDQMVKFIKNNIIIKNSINVKDKQQMKIVMDKAIETYIVISEKYEEIRYRINVSQNMIEMVACYLNTRIIVNA